MIEYIEQSDPRYGPPAPVPIIQEETEFSRLLDLYRGRQPLAVLEVGTYAGGTLFHWLQNAPTGANVVSVDLYEDKDNSALYPDWCASGVACEVVRGDSRDPATVEAARAFAPYDWIFIDAGHLESEVRPDWANYGPMARPGGVVAFHDIVHHDGLPSIQTPVLWAEIAAVYDTDEIIDDSGTSSGIGVVYVPAEGVAS